MPQAKGRLIMPNSQRAETPGNLLENLIVSPIFKDDMRAVLRSLDGPDTGRDLVRTFLWQDLEFSLGLLSGLPILANVLIRAFDEALLQVDDKFSPELLGSFVGSLLEDIDKPALARALRRLGPVIENLAPRFRKAWQEVLMEGDPS
jgi:hypothetical protein